MSETSEEKKSIVPVQLMLIKKPEELRK